MSAQVYTDYRQFLAAAEVDVVSVVVPSDLHYEIGRAVLESGRHLFVEKPMALCATECSELIDLAATCGRWIAVGHELRFSPLWGKVKTMIDDGSIGSPLYALIELWRRPYRSGSADCRYKIERVGNWALEEPIHFFDLARWYFSKSSDPTHVYAQAIGRRPDHPELTDNFSALMTFRGGSYAVVSQTLSGWEHHQTVKITETSGALWTRWSGAIDRTFEPTYQLQWLDGVWVVDVPLGGTPGEVFELVEEIRMIVRAVQLGAAPSCTGADGRWSVAMCLAAQKSIDRQFAGCVLVSDQECWVGSGRQGSTAVLTEWQAFVANQVRLHDHAFAGPKLVCINIQPYATTQAPERTDILNIGGFSDAVFKVISAFLRDEPGRFVAEVEAIE